MDTGESAPQGGPLSPLLSNIVLDELDKELESRGHRFVRYADDCNIYVKTRKAGERVKKSITSFIENRLKLKVNQEKSAVDRPWKRKFLGFSFTWNKDPKIRIAQQSMKKVKAKIREITSEKTPAFDGATNKGTKPVPYGMVWLFCLSRHAKYLS